MNSALKHLCDNVLRNFGFQTMIIVGGPVVREGGKLGSFVCVTSNIFQFAPRIVTDMHSFESSGTALKQLSFSQFCGTSYTDILEKFTEYIKLCYRTWLRLNTALLR